MSQSVLGVSSISPSLGHSFSFHACPFPLVQSQSSTAHLQLWLRQSRSPWSSLITKFFSQCGHLSLAVKGLCSNPSRILICVCRLLIEWLISSINRVRFAVGQLSIVSATQNNDRSVSLFGVAPWSLSSLSSASHISVSVRILTIASSTSTRSGSLGPGTERLERSPVRPGVSSALRSLYHVATSLSSWAVSIRGFSNT